MQEAYFRLKYQSSVHCSQFWINLGLNVITFLRNARISQFIFQYLLLLLPLLENVAFTFSSCFTNITFLFYFWSITKHLLKMRYHLKCQSSFMAFFIIEYLHLISIIFGFTHFFIKTDLIFFWVLKLTGNLRILEFEYS